jgi:hypothetical protein
MISFEEIKEAALAQAPRLLADWFPAGRLRGNEFKIGNLNGDPDESLSININTGQWGEFAGVERGGDLISLRAAARHRGDNSAAARELSSLLGVHGSGQAHGPNPTRTAHADYWEPSIPPPPAVEPPPESDLLRFDTIHEYTDAYDRVTHYVGRTEARGNRRKTFTPITYGTLNGVTGWHHRAPGKPLPIYGLNRLSSRPDVPVIICEGEKAADAAQAMFVDYACVAWFGGSGRVDDADLRPLQAREVIIWPDNDEAGAGAAVKLTARLPRARVLRVGDLPTGGDAADVVVDDQEEWLNARLPPAVEGTPTEAVADALCARRWATLEVKPDERLLGDVITSSTRAFIVGGTGLGKTNFVYAMVGGMATGKGFLGLTCDRPSRWLIIDGEMPTALVKTRAADMIRRAGAGAGAMLPGSVMIYCRDRAAQFAQDYPSLGHLAPLNTVDGHRFVLSLIEASGGVDGVVFDNLMSLAPGDQKDEEVWAGCTPLVEALSQKGIAQIWCDHTGHNAGRQYGSNTKAWRFDCVAIMTPLADNAQGADHLAFRLSFDHPGKARRRTPDNWRQFEPRVIRLIDDRWISESPNSGTAERKMQHLKPAARAYYNALLDSLAVTLTPGRTTRSAWYAECVRLGLTEAIRAEDNYREKERKLKPFRARMSELKIAEWIGVEGDTVTALRPPK